MGKDRALSTAAAEARKEYRRNWAKNNPEKVREQQRRYWERVAAQQGKEAEPDVEKSN